MGGLDCEILGDLTPRLIVGVHIRIEIQLVGVRIDQLFSLDPHTLVLVCDASSRHIRGSTEAASLSGVGLG